MRKFFIAILFILASTMAINAQQVIYHQTFEDTANLFQSYVLANYDKADPIGNEWDTLRSVPWFVNTAGSAGNHAAIATSNYLGDTVANDWFVTPAIRIGKASTLSWNSLSLTSEKTDTYQVYISTTEQSVAGCLFNGAAGSYTSDNSTAPITNTLDLSNAGYADQTIFIGFRLNTKSGGDKIAIDDINVTESSTQFVSLTFIVNMSEYIADTLFNPGTDTVDIAGTFNNFDGKKNILSIVPGSDSAIYSTTIAGFLDGDQLEFKFRINSSWNDTAVEFPYGQPNRSWTVEHDQYTYISFYNDLAVTFGISENKLMEQVTVYPNPAQSMVWVGIPKGIKKVSMVNLTGQKVLNRESLTGNIVNLDLSTVSKGTYIMLFYTEQGFAGSKKLIKN
ncbi:MAG: choice-of-anchor J domain-containing protein [Bacteroidales bacterium]|nr:choice-of-anchor J domain-containing protein [Bacteroidales bacterium]